MLQARSADDLLTRIQDFSNLGICFAFSGFEQNMGTSNDRSFIPTRSNNRLQFLFIARQKCDFVFFHVTHLTRTIHLYQVAILEAINHHKHHSGQHI